MDGHRVVFVNGAFCFFYLSSQQSIPVYTEGREIERRKEGRREKEERRRRERKRERGRSGKHPLLFLSDKSFDWDSSHWGCRYSKVVALPWRWNTSCWRGSLIVSLSFTLLVIWYMAVVEFASVFVCARLTGTGLGKRVMQSWKSEVFNWSIVSAKPLNGSQKCDVIKADVNCYKFQQSDFSSLNCLYELILFRSDFLGAKSVI